MARYGVPPQGHLQGPTRDKSNAFFSQFKGTYIHLLLRNIFCSYVSYHTFFKGINFVLSYSTQRRNAFVARSLVKVKSKRFNAFNCFVVNLPTSQIYLTCFDYQIDLENNFSLFPYLGNYGSFSFVVMREVAKTQAA